MAGLNIDLSLNFKPLQIQKSSNFMMILGS